MIRPDLAVCQQAKTATARAPAAAAGGAQAVVDVLQVEAARKLIAGRGRVGQDGAAVRAAVDLHAHADGARVRAVRQEAHLAGHHPRTQSLK